MGEDARCEDTDRIWPHAEQDLRYRHFQLGLEDPEGKVSPKATAISWTLWGKVAVNASWHLVGSKVAVVGTLEGNRYTLGLFT